MPLLATGHATTDALAVALGLLTVILLPQLCSSCPGRGAPRAGLDADADAGAVNRARLKQRGELLASVGGGAAKAD